MRKGKDRRSAAQYAYEICASEMTALPYMPEWRDLTPDQQAAFTTYLRRDIQQWQESQGTQEDD